MIEEKQFLLDEVKDQIAAFPSFIIMRYLKLTANKAGEFRRQVAGLGGAVGVMRKRILRRAAKDAGIDLDASDLTGHIGLVYAKDNPTELAKYVATFSEENDKAVEIAGGYIEGELYQGPEVVYLSQLPDKDEMRAQLLGLFEAPMAEMLAVVDALLTSVIHCMDNKCEGQGEDQAQNEAEDANI